MTRAEALQILRLDEGASPEAVNGAFKRLAARYPVQHFSERVREIYEAFELLTDPVKRYTDVLEQEPLDLSFLRGAVRSERITLDLRPRTQRELRENLLRCAIVSRGLPIFG